MYKLLATLGAAQLVLPNSNQMTFAANQSSIKDWTSQIAASPQLIQNAKFFEYIPAPSHLASQADIQNYNLKVNSLTQELQKELPVDNANWFIGSKNYDIRYQNFITLLNRVLSVDPFKDPVALVRSSLNAFKTRNGNTNFNFMINDSEFDSVFLSPLRNILENPATVKSTSVVNDSVISNFYQQICDSDPSIKNNILNPAQAFNKVLSDFVGKNTDIKNVFSSSNIQAIFGTNATDSNGIINYDAIKNKVLAAISNSLSKDDFKSIYLKLVDQFHDALLTNLGPMKSIFGDARAENTLWSNVTKTAVDNYVNSLDDSKLDWIVTATQNTPTSISDNNFTKIFDPIAKTNYYNKVSDFFHDVVAMTPKNIAKSTYDKMFDSGNQVILNDFVPKQDLNSLATKWKIANLDSFTGENSPFKIVKNSVVSQDAQGNQLFKLDFSIKNNDNFNSDNLSVNGVPRLLTSNNIAVHYALKDLITDLQNSYKNGTLGTIAGHDLLDMHSSTPINLSDYEFMTRFDEIKALSPTQLIKLFAPSSNSNGQDWSTILKNYTGRLPGYSFKITGFTTEYDANDEKGLMTINLFFTFTNGSDVQELKLNNGTLKIEHFDLQLFDKYFADMDRYINNSSNFDYERDLPPSVTSLLTDEKADKMSDYLFFPGAYFVKTFSPSASMPPRFGFKNAPFLATGDPNDANTKAENSGFAFIFDYNHPVDSNKMQYFANVTFDADIAKDDTSGKISFHGILPRIPTDSDPYFKEFTVPVFDKTQFAKYMNNQVGRIRSICSNLATKLVDNKELSEASRDEFLGKFDQIVSEMQTNLSNSLSTKSMFFVSKSTVVELWNLLKELTKNTDSVKSIYQSTSPQEMPALDASLDKYMHTLLWPILAQKVSASVENDLLDEYASNLSDFKDYELNQWARSLRDLQNAHINKWTKVGITAVAGVLGIVGLGTAAAPISTYLSVRRSRKNTSSVVAFKKGKKLFAMQSIISFVSLGVSATLLVLVFVIFGGII